MIIRSPKPVSGYTVVDNRILNNANLSYRARGVLAFILSKPDHWQTNATQLARSTRGEGRDAILTALRELEVEGYVVRTRQQDSAGRWSTVVTVFDMPACGNDCGEPGSPMPEKPNSENQASKKELTSKYSEKVSDMTHDVSWRICGRCGGGRWLEHNGDLVPCEYCRGEGVTRHAGR